jgi:ankyrin repeat protein
MIQPLHIATQCGRTDIMKMLIDAGADVNALNLKHNTPLAYAATGLTSTAVKLLLSRKAVRRPNNQDCHTPRVFADRWAAIVRRSEVTESATYGKYTAVWLEISSAGTIKVDGDERRNHAELVGVAGAIGTILASHRT